MPRPMLPNQRTGSPDIVGLPRSGATANTGTYVDPNDRSMMANLRRILIKMGRDPDEIDFYIQNLEAQQAAFTASSGYQNKALQAQINDAKRGRQNAYKIAELQAKTSRYGTDQSTMVQLRQMEQEDRQFQANHGLEISKAYTQFASTPDMMFARNDFMNAVGRTGAGYSPAPMAQSAGSPKAKTYEDFAALTNYNGGGGAGYGAQAGAGSGTDKRLKAMRAVTDAMPPSDGVGHDGQDWAAIDAIKNLYFSGRPGDVERLGEPRRKIAQAGLARAGYDPALVEHERMRGLPGQRSVRAA